LTTIPIDEDVDLNELYHTDLTEVTYPRHLQKNTNECRPKMPQPVRISDISYKSTSRKRMDPEAIQHYSHELEKMVSRDKKQFWHNFSHPVRQDPLEYDNPSLYRYLRNLRFYGLQKTDEGTEYTMMQESINCELDIQFLHKLTKVLL